MPLKIPVGCEFFDNLIKRKCYYVDKTKLIYDLVEGREDNAVTLFTRPRRFGKTLTLSMLECFFSNQRNDGQKLFGNYTICKDYPEICNEWMNKYPVLFITLKDAEGNSFDLAYKILRNTIATICKENASLLKHPDVNPADAEIFNRLMYKEGDMEETLSALDTIMRMMHAAYGKKVILLIDEYDVPLAKAYENGYYREMLDVIRRLMSTSLKTNRHLEFAVIIGCLRIPKESIFTGVNHFASYSVMDKKFSNYFGFTEEEVYNILESAAMTGKMDLIREWYDGYQFGNSNIYCPWDVVNYVAALLEDPDERPGMYWENTSDNGAVLKLFELKDPKISRRLETLANGGTISETVTNSLTYGDAYKSESNLWSILLMTGYVTTAEWAAKSTSDGRAFVNLRIPNLEIQDLFVRKISDHFKMTVDQSKIVELMSALWNKDEDKASDILSDLLFRTISYMNYKEDFYQGFMAGVFTGRGYNTRTDREQGTGRSDVMIKPQVSLPEPGQKRGLICEAKVSDSEEAMDHWCDEAIKQIIKRRYTEDPDFDGCNEILCYGIAFYKKSAKVKLMRK